VIINIHIVFATPTETYRIKSILTFIELRISLSWPEQPSIGQYPEPHSDTKSSILPPQPLQVVTYLTLFSLKLRVYLRVHIQTYVPTHLNSPLFNLNSTR